MGTERTDQDDGRPRMPAAARVLFYVLAWVFIAQLGAAVVMAIAGGIFYGSRILTGPEISAELPPLPLLGVFEVAALLLTLGVTALFVVVVDRRPFPSLGFERVRGWGAHWALGFAIEGFHFGGLFVLGLLAGWYHVQAAAPLARAAAILLVAVAIALPAAAVEEIVTRGYVHQAIAGRYGTVWGVVVNSALFSVLHLSSDLLALLGLFIAGVYLTVAYLATRQLWLPIAMHTAWNVFEGPVFGLPVSGIDMPDSVLRVRTTGPPLWTGGEFGPEAGLPVLFTTVVMTGVVWVAARRLLPRPNADDTASMPMSPAGPESAEPDSFRH